jgi:hypothetical protein
MSDGPAFGRQHAHVSLRVHRIDFAKLAGRKAGSSNKLEPLSRS